MNKKVDIGDAVFIVETDGVTVVKEICSKPIYPSIYGLKIGDTTPLGRKIVEIIKKNPDEDS
jgi:hypothetical protein